MSLLPMHSPMNSSMNQVIKIQPFSSVTTTVATSFSVSCRSLVLFSGATFTVDLFDASGSLLNRQIVPMSPEEYAAWKNDDAYVINLFAVKLGFTIVAADTAGVQSTP